MFTTVDNIQINIYTYSSFKKIIKELIFYNSCRQ